MGSNPNGLPLKLFDFTHSRENATNPIQFPDTQRLGDSLKKKITRDKLWSCTAFFYLLAFLILIKVQGASDASRSAEAPARTAEGFSFFFSFFKVNFFHKGIVLKGRKTAYIDVKWIYERLYRMYLLVWQRRSELPVLLK